MFLVLYFHNENTERNNKILGNPFFFIPFIVGDQIRENYFFISYITNIQDILWSKKAWLDKLNNNQQQSYFLLS